MFDVVKLVEDMTRRGLSVSTAESLTGGLLAGTLIDAPGASHVFSEGFVTYSNGAKEKRIGVARAILDHDGPVSAPCARMMAEGAARASASAIGLSTTGIAGPGGGTDDKPVGLVYIGIYQNGVSKAREFHFKGNRAQIRNQTVLEALKILKEEIDQL